MAHDLKEYPDDDPHVNEEEFNKLSEEEQKQINKENWEELRDCDAEDQEKAD